MGMGNNGGGRMGVDGLELFWSGRAVKGRKANTSNRW